MGTERATEVKNAPSEVNTSSLEAGRVRRRLPGEDRPTADPGGLEMVGTRPGIVVHGSACAPRVQVEAVPRYLPPWKPVKGAFVRVFTGWEWIRAEIMTGIHDQTREFGVRLFAFQKAGPWYWLRMNGRGAVWKEEAGG